MDPRQTYRFRAPASGREAIATSKPGHAYRDRETGETMQPVSAVLPLAESGSKLLRTPENLHACARCDQLLERDVTDCPYCAKRQ